MKNQTVLNQKNDIEFEIDSDKYEVVRQEYFGGTNEPQFTFNRGRAYINGYGLKAMDCCDYVHIMIDKDRKLLIIRQCEKKTKDALKWSTSGKKKRPRHMRCIPLYYLVYEMMGWNVQARYRITGFQRLSNNEKILCFDLQDAVCYLPTGEYDSLGRPVVVERFPKEWEGGFGIALMEYEKQEYVSEYEEAMRFQIELPVDDRKREEVMNATTEEIVTENK